tara:strand:+ start:7287 stop:8087 length:801 start_codon:yes stop_codon:yes gene_type:complete
MKNTLWTFGDSFTEGNGCLPGNLYYEKTFDTKNPQAIWTKLLSNRLSFKLEDFSMGGASNPYILRNVISNIDKIKSGDIVVIGYTDDWRFEISGPHRMHQVLINSIEGYDTFHEEESIGKEQNKLINDVMTEYCKEIHMMKLHNPDGNERYSFEIIAKEIKTQFNSLIKHFHNNKIKVVTFNWDMEDFCGRYEDITKATKTNHQIKNFHLSWKGHKSLNDDIFKLLKSKDILVNTVSVHINDYLVVERLSEPVKINFLLDKNNKLI